MVEKVPRQRPKCGTNGGYLAHRRRGEEACEPCKTAHAELAGNTREAAGSKRRPPPRHGTRAGYERERRAHRKGGPAPCEACTAANSVRSNALYATIGQVAGRIDARGK